jgi:hypothetical protein
VMRSGFFSAVEASTAEQLRTLSDPFDSKSWRDTQIGQQMRGERLLGDALCFDRLRLGFGAALATLRVRLDRGQRCTLALDGG